MARALVRGACALLLVISACVEDAPNPGSDMWNLPMNDGSIPGDGDGDLADGSSHMGEDGGAQDAGVHAGADAADGAGSEGTDSSVEGRDDGGGMPADPESGRLVGITAAHNAARAMVDTNSPLPPLAWSPEIAEVAQAYAEQLADNCSTTLVHSGTAGLGENIWWFGRPFGPAAGGSAQQAVDGWFGEVECYTYGPFSRDPSAYCDLSCTSRMNTNGCGHYTQVAWRKTERVGCGVADCEAGQGRGSYWVCNYDPPGNYYGQYPY